jgi:hypothetical protein
VINKTVSRDVLFAIGSLLEGRISNPVIAAFYGPLLPGERHLQRIVVASGTQPIY